MILNPCKSLIVILVAASGLSRSSFAQNPSNWSYGAFNAPPTGRRNFQLLRAGQRRASRRLPLNIQPTTLPKIEFDYNGATFLVENINYATEILAPTVSGSPTNSITLNGDTYNLVQIHFHFPAEHTLPRVQNAVMETHFVHQDAKNNILVIAVLTIIGDPPNHYVEQIWKNLPTSYGGHGSVTINPKMLLPEERNNSDRCSCMVYVPRNPFQRSRRPTEGEIVVYYCARSDWNPSRVGHIELAEDDFVVPDFAKEILEYLDG